MKFLVTFVLLSAACVFATPIQGDEPISPSFDAYSDVRIMLSTRENRNNPVRLAFRDLSSIQASFYNPAKPLRVTIHGWQEDGSSDISTETSRELLDLYDFNVMFIDWSAGASTINYMTARNRVPAIGTFLSSYLDFLHENNLLDFSRLTVIGFSLGAHIAGMAGKGLNRGRINTIIGLDPAGPLFSVNTPAERLDAGDAAYVEAIHTNGGAMGSGIGAVIAHADFFPNGGSVQPGCLNNICSHLRAVSFYVESIQDNRFQARRCSSQTEAFWGLCTQMPGALMGGEPSNHASSLRGIFHLTTNNNPPFARG